MANSFNLYKTQRRYTSQFATPTVDDRTELENDITRVINSSFFRRMQGKTQVFPFEENDFPRTRLTHSLEVATLAYSIGLSIEKMVPQLVTTKVHTILYVAGLLHDIGNPPFGHYGEVMINEFFNSLGSGKCEVGLQDAASAFVNLSVTQQRELQNFDGNAQGFRIATHLGESYHKYGFNLTSAVLATIVKYPYSVAQFMTGGGKHIGYYEPENDYYNYVVNSLEYQVGQVYPLTYLLEAADDIAYIVSDLQDGLEMKSISLGDIDKCGLFPQMDSQAENAYVRMRVKIQDYLIDAVVNKFKQQYNYIEAVAVNGGSRVPPLLEGNPLADHLRKLGRINLKLPKLNKREIMGGTVVKGLLTLFSMALFDTSTKKQQKFLSLIPEDLQKANLCAAQTNDFTNAYDKFRLIVDFVTSLTDRNAIALYQELAGLNLPID